MYKVSPEALLILVVLYNTPAAQSATLTSLLSQTDIGFATHLVIWDNSPQSMKDDALLYDLEGRFASVRYMHDGTNKPLSKLYNDVIRENSADLYLILDQDSDLQATYVANISKAAAENRDIALFAPQVIVGGKLVSPGGFGKVRGRQLADVPSGPVPARDFTVITSGLLFRREIFTRHALWFNENLWLYCVDTDFFLRFRDVCPTFYITGERIGHSSALRENLPLDQQLFRFWNLRWSYLTMMRNQNRSVPMAYGYMAAMSLSRTMKQRSLKFLTGWDRSR